MADPTTSMPNWTTTAGNIAFPALGAMLQNNQQQAGANGAIGMSVYNPYGINGPYGSVGTDASGNYNLGSSPAFAPFGNLSTNAGNYANSQFAGPNQYDTSANGVMSAFNNFNPTTFANNEYGQLSALTAPTQTNQTQQMLNYEQASGRGGLTQNGQLGDLGGLALSQSLTNTNNALQAQTDARNQGNYLANLATTFQNQGNTQRTNAMQNAGAGLSNTLNINQSLQQMLQNSINASNARAQAGARAGGFRMSSGINSANLYGNLFGGINQASAPYGGVGSMVNSGIGALKGMFGGSGSGDTSGVNWGAPGSSSNPYSSYNPGAVDANTGLPVGVQPVADSSPNFGYGDEYSYPS